MLDRKHFKVKLLRFNAGGAISLQRHEHRGEAWLFLSGLGNICNCEDGDFTGIAKAGDYWHAGKGKWHRYQAIKHTWVLEIQYGERCVEEDIVRSDA